MILYSKRCVFLIWFTLGYTSAYSHNQLLDDVNQTCLTHPDVQHLRSKELAELVDLDQKDRENWDELSEEEKTNIAARDLKRRMRVGEIFGEGCFKTTADYSAASLIYQHWDVPDHYYQAFIWANEAVSLGDAKQKHLVALTIDRYLVSIGKKQLFGSQAFASDNSNWCFCLEPIESSFPDALRLDYLGSTLSQQYDWLSSINEGKNDCPTAECQHELKPTPKGSIPGFW